MRLDVLTIFPDYFAPLELSLLGKAREQGLLDVAVHDLRTYAVDRHRTVDDTPYGGGPGMVMKPDVWGRALDSVASSGAEGRTPVLVVPTPGGQVFTQGVAADLATRSWLVFACGRYEGIDARVGEDAAERMPVLELSLGDYVVNGGEVAVLAMVEAVARLLPGVLGNEESLADESHAAGVLEAPVYTRPPTWRGRDVPSVLLSGDHAAIARWRRTEALRRTAARRPDLLEQLDPAACDAGDLAVLHTLGWGVRDGRFSPAAGPVAD